jgi:hypothetical protein
LKSKYAKFKFDRVHLVFDPFITTFCKCFKKLHDDATRR